MITEAREPQIAETGMPPVGELPENSLAEPERPQVAAAGVPQAGGAELEKSRKFFFNRELSWLAFARRVLALAEDPELPLAERVKFVAIMGMLHDEFFMKRMGGLKRKLKRRPDKPALDGRKPAELLAACRRELLEQTTLTGRLVQGEIRPAMADAGVPIVDHRQLEAPQQKQLRDLFRESVLPILTPLAVDAEHPFPFISNQGLNLAILVPDKTGEAKPRLAGAPGVFFVRLKVPDNRPRWMPVPGGPGFVPLEQVIAANLDLLFPAAPPREVFLFRVTRAAQGKRQGDFDPGEPGSIIHLVASELKARKFAGAVRLEIESRAPDWLIAWLIQRLGVGEEDVYRTKALMRLDDLMSVELPDHPELRLPRHQGVTHPRLRALEPGDRQAIFCEIARGDLLVHHPYHSFDTSVLRFLESAATDPAVLAIKLTIYRTSKDSPIVQALAEAARRGKQVAVLVEITARFDEAPNIAWGRYLENEGVHVAYGVEQLKTHVKLALVVREEAGAIRRYAHVGTGNYHTGTARIYEDLGILTCDSELCEDVAAVFNQLTGATRPESYNKMLVAPETMRQRFIELIRREAEHARAGRPCGIQAKMNQLQERHIIAELYRASAAGVPIRLNVRGLCCLRPQVPGLSENIEVFGVISRFLEHSRIYRFVNGGSPELYVGSADWMKRNLYRRVETIAPVSDEGIREELTRILEVYERDNCTVWDARPDGTYVRRRPAPGEEPRPSQETFIRLAGESVLSSDATPDRVGRAGSRAGKLDLAEHSE